MVRLGYCPTKHFHFLARTWQQLDKFFVTNLTSLGNVYSHGGKNTHFILISALHQESNNMVVPAMQLASKIPDMSVQLWSSALLRGKLGKGLVLKKSSKEPIAANWGWGGAVPMPALAERLPGFTKYR